MVQLRHQYSIEEAPGQGTKLLGFWDSFWGQFLGQFLEQLVMGKIVVKFMGQFFETKCTYLIERINTKFKRKS